MIRRLRIQNYKSLRDLDIPLSPFTVFVGANGSGKSSVLAAVDSLVRSTITIPDDVFAREHHGDWIYTRGGNGPLAIRCETEGGQFEIEAAVPAAYPPSPERMGSSKWKFRIAPPSPELKAALAPAKRVAFLQLDANRLAMPSYSEVDPPRMDSTGEGLASVLASMALYDPRGFEDLVAQARALIPRLRYIRFRKAKVFKTEYEVVKIGNDSLNRQTRRSYQGEMILFDFENAENISAQTASEGTMLMLGLLSVLHGPNRPQVLLLDDLERGLHPLAQEKMVEVIGQVMKKFPDLQVIATTHSPYLLNYLSPEQVRIMAIDDQGHARCGLLADHPKFETWKNEMAPGEMWSLFGEKWLAEKGAPA